MSDPTNLVLTLCFLTSLVIGGICVVARFLRSGAGSIGPPSIPKGKVAIWFYRPLDLLGPALIFFIFAGFFALAAAAPDQAEISISASVLVFNIGFQFMIAGVMVALAMQRTTLNNWLGLRWQGWQWVFLIAPGCVLLMWLVFWGIHSAGYMEWMESLGVETIQDTVQLFQESNDPLLVGLMAFTAVIAAPLCEEIVFRGYFYPVMKKFSGAWPAAVCSGLVFAAAHGSLAVLLPLFILGILLVWVYEKTGSLWAPIAVHFCFNAATVSLQLIARLYDLPAVQASP